MLVETRVEPKFIVCILCRKNEEEVKDVQKSGTIDRMIIKNRISIHIRINNRVWIHIRIKNRISIHIRINNREWIHFRIKNRL